MTDPALLFGQAVTLHRAGHSAEAATIYRQLLAQFPGHGPLLDLLGTAEIQTGHPEDGVAHIGDALHRLGLQPPVLSHLGTGLQALGRLSEALDCFDRALALQPDFVEAQFNRANVLIALQRHAEALTALETTLALAPQHGPAHYNRATLLATLGRDDEAVTAFSHAIALSPQAVEAYINRATVLLRLGRLQEALADYDAVIARRPDDAQAYAKSGALLIGLDQLAQAEARLSRAITLSPQDYDSWNNRGNARLGLHRGQEALADFDQALVLAPDFAAAHSNRGNALMALGQIDAAILSFDRALSLDPKHADAWTNKGLAWRAKAALPRALECFDQALRLAPDHADATFDKAHVLLLSGDLAQGFALYESRWRRNPFRRIAWNRPEPMWQGEDITGKTLLIRPEQGYGDFVMACRYGPWAAARGARVILAAPPPLRNLVSTLNMVTVITSSDDPGPVDYHCPVMSLPRAFATTLQNIPPAPYLTADPIRREKLSTSLGAKKRPRIGLVVSGDDKHLNDANRSIPLAALAPLLEQPCDFYLAQQGLRPADRTESARWPNLHLPPLADFADTAALIAEMDLTVSVDSAPAHVAGAIGAPVWILLPFAPDWRWLTGRSDSPWYASAQLWRQRSPRDWPGVIETVAKKLAARFDL